jgi:hypothetical protein
MRWRHPVGVLSRPNHADQPTDRTLLVIAGVPKPDQEPTFKSAKSNSEHSLLVKTYG